MAYVAKDSDDFLPYRRAPSHNLEVDAKPTSLKWQLPGEYYIVPATTISPPPPHLDDSTSDGSPCRALNERNSHRRRIHEGPKTTTDGSLVPGSADHRRRSNGCRVDNVHDVQKAPSPRVDSVFDVDVAESSEAEKVDGGLVLCSGALPDKPTNIRVQKRMIEDFTLPLKHVDTIDLRSVRRPRLRWHGKSPTKFVVNMVATGRDRLRRHTSLDSAVSKPQSPDPPQSDASEHDPDESQRDAEGLRHWLRTYGDDRQWGTIPYDGWRMAWSEDAVRRCNFGPQREVDRKSC